MKRRKWKWILRCAVLSFFLIGSTLLIGCVRFVGDTWLIREAPVPVGWPEPTAIGKIKVKQYPSCRAAAVTAEGVEGSGQEPMFMTLFRHIKKNKIAMTAPVAMGYKPDEPRPEMASMSFMYKDPQMG